MDCEICLESFNQSDRVPKVLQFCGHTFCNLCLSRIYSGQRSTISCPLCRYKIKTDGQQPPTNFALLQAIETLEDEREGKGFSRFVKPKFVPFGVEKWADLRDYQKRSHAPHFMKLLEVQDGGETLYCECSKEEFQQYAEKKLKYFEEVRRQNTTLSRQLSQKQSQIQESIVSPQVAIEEQFRMSSQRYSFHPRSLFSRFFGMGLQSKALFPFAKSLQCRHAFGCFERMLRSFASVATMYICAKTIIESLLPEKFNFWSSLSWLVQDHLKIGQHWSNQRLLLFSFGIQSTFVAFLSLYRVRGCFSRHREGSEKDEEQNKEEPATDNEEDKPSYSPL